MTRLVTASQSLPNGDRKILIALLDWHIVEPGLLDYSSCPIHEYPKPDSLESMTEYLSSLPKKVQEQFKATFGLFSERYFTVRPCPSMAVENVYGLSPRKTSQDEMELTKRTNAQWIKAKEKLNEAETSAALG